MVAKLGPRLSCPSSSSPSAVPVCRGLLPTPEAGSAARRCSASLAAQELQQLQNLLFKNSLLLCILLNIYPAGTMLPLPHPALIPALHSS